MFVIASVSLSILVSTTNSALALLSAPLSASLSTTASSLGLGSPVTRVFFMLSTLTIALKSDRTLVSGSILMPDLECTILLVLITALVFTIVSTIPYLLTSISASASLST